MRSTERFTGLANVYGQARPTYPLELVRWCLEQVPAPSLIVDLGCGTGISTRLFATTGHPVIGIDPNADMLAAARAEGAQDLELIDSMHPMSQFEKYELGLKPKPVYELVPEFFRSFES